MSAGTTAEAENQTDIPSKVDADSRISVGHFLAALICEVATSAFSTAACSHAPSEWLSPASHHRRAAVCEDSSPWAVRGTGQAAVTKYSDGQILGLCFRLSPEAR